MILVSKQHNLEFSGPNEPKWSQLHAKRVTERMQCCFGGIVDRAEYVWNDLVIVSKIGSCDEDTQTCPGDGSNLHNSTLRLDKQGQESLAHSNDREKVGLERLANLGELYFHRGDGVICSDQYLHSTSNYSRKLRYILRPLLDISQMYRTRGKTSKDTHALLTR